MGISRRNDFSTSQQPGGASEARVAFSGYDQTYENNGAALSHSSMPRYQEVHSPMASESKSQAQNTRSILKQRSNG